VIAGFAFDPQALKELHDVLETNLAPIDIPDELTAPMSAVGKRQMDAPTPEHVRVYIDAYIDFSRLVEEIRFEAGWALSR
jgi:hypothetical protein